MNDKQDLTVAELPAELDSTYIYAATSDNTRRSYQSDIDHFLRAGFKLPATADTIERYLQQCADGYNPRTLVRHIAPMAQVSRFE